MSAAPFSLRLKPEVKAALEKEAALMDRSAAYVAQQAIEKFLDASVYKRECLREAIAEADRGIFISEEAMDRWVDSWGTENELPLPEPDIFPGPVKS